jgi:hypothetical protein
MLLLAVLAAPANAAADELVVRDSKVRSVWAADGVVLYSRAGNSARRPLERQWMRVVDGKAKRARGVPRGASPYEMTNVSRDAAGRAVIPFSARRQSGVRRWTTRWWSYDLRSDRARPMSHIPSMTCIGTRWVAKSCDVCVNAVASWGRSRAWSKCLDGGVFLRRHGRTIRVADREASHLALRGGTLVGEVEGRQSTGVLALLAVRGKRCGTTFDATKLEDDGVDRGRVWLSGKDVVSFDAGAFVGTRLPRGCGAPGATGAFDQPVLDYPIVPLAGATLDGRTVYYADLEGVHRTALSERFRSGPPDNDDFANARLLGDAPIQLTTVVGNATRQAGEPNPTYTRTSWFAFRPQTTRPVWIPSYLGWSSAVGAFIGTNVAALTPAGVPEPHDGPLRVDAVAGQTYWIQVACSFACYMPSDIRVSTTPR